MAAAVLTSEEHNGATYELLDQQALSPDQIADVLSQQLKRKVRSEVIPLNTWAEEARGGGLGGYALDSLTKMFRYYDRHGLVGNSKVLEGLLRRPPRTFLRFVERIPSSQDSRFGN